MDKGEPQYWGGGGVGVWQRSQSHLGRRKLGVAWLLAPWTPPSSGASRSPESLSSSGALRAPFLGPQHRVCRRPPRLALPAAWCPLKVTADRALACTGRGGPRTCSGVGSGSGPAGIRDSWGWAPMDRKPRKRRGGPEPRTGGAPASHLHRLRERDAAAVAIDATGARLAGPGPAAAAAPLPRRPALASPGGPPPPACLPPSLATAASATAALRSARLPPLPAPSSSLPPPGALPFGPPQTPHGECPAGPLSAVQPAPPITRTSAGLPQEGSLAFPGRLLQVLHQNLTPYPTPPPPAVRPLEALLPLVLGALNHPAFPHTTETFVVRVTPCGVN